MLADVVDYGEFKLGSRNESILFSTQTFVVKLAGALSGFITGAGLSLIGFVANQVQSPGTVAGLRVIMGGIPMAFSIVYLLVFWKFYRLGAAFLRKIRETLAQRKGIRIFPRSLPKIRIQDSDFSPFSSGAGSGPSSTTTSAFPDRGVPVRQSRLQGGRHTADSGLRKNLSAGSPFGTSPPDPLLGATPVWSIPDSGGPVQCSGRLRGCFSDHFWNVSPHGILSASVFLPIRYTAICGFQEGKTGPDEFFIQKTEYRSRSFLHSCGDTPYSALKFRKTVRDSPDRFSPRFRSGSSPNGPGTRPLWRAFGGRHTA